MERKNRRKEAGSFWVRNFATDKSGKNLSWGSVFAGALTFVASFILLSMITSALGFGFITPTSSNPFSAAGTATFISLILTLAISMFAGGFVSGLAARKTGLLHGFLTWALSLVLMLTVVTSAISTMVNTAVSVTSSVVSETAQVVGSAAGSAGEVAGQGINALLEEAKSQIQDIDTSSLERNIEEILRDTEVRELQPEYLQSMANQSKQEITSAGRELLVNPENYETILGNLISSLSNRVETLNNAVDEEAIKSAVAQNTDLSQDEADAAVENIITGIDEASKEMQKQLTNVQASIEQTKVEVERTIEEAKIATEEATNTISKVFTVVFFGLVIGLALSSYGGLLGAQKVKGTVFEE